MSRFLFVTWDGAGNLVPTLGLAQRLAARRHDVRVLGHRSIDARVGRAGWRFRELRWTADVDSARGRAGGDDMHAMARQVWFDGGICKDVRDELSREAADVVVGNVTFAGPFLDAPPLLAPDDGAIDGTTTPPILVSFSTSQQGHLPVLQRVVEALSASGLRAIVTTGPAIDPGDLRGGSSVEIVRFAAHDRILRHAALVITHAGMGTVMSALAHGVPLLCLPVGRDQFFNAARVTALGAGRTLDAGSEPAAIEAAIEALLADSAAAGAARQMARIIAAYDGGAAAVGAMERIAEAVITTAR